MDPNDIRALLTEGRLEPALLGLLDLLDAESGVADDVRVLLARLRGTERDVEAGILASADRTQTAVQLTRAALRILRETGLLAEDRQQPSQSESGRASKANADPSSAEVFLSYKWGGQSEFIAERIESLLESDGHTVVRDKRALGFREDIEEFMARLSRGRAVVCVLSDGYLRSANCMRELEALMNQSSGIESIFPVVLPDARIYRATERLQYVQFWQAQRLALNDTLRALTDQAGLATARAEIDLYDGIARSVDALTGWLKRMNAFELHTHMNTDFAALRKALLRRLHPT